MVARCDDAERLLSRLSLTRPSWQRSTSELDELRVSLREAEAWCRQRADRARVATCLRPETLAPQTLPDSRWSAVHSVVHARRRSMSLSGSDNGPVPLAHGRLLIYFPDCDLACGAAEVESEGFFDANNAPPWGTWVGYFEEEGGGDACCANYLLAFVPEVFGPLVQAGIEVNPEECILWLDSTNVALRQIAHLLVSG